MRKHSRPLLGLAFLGLIALLVLTSVQTFRKAMPWQRSVHVTLTTATPGLELNPHSDVKLQGVLVGEVRSITSDGRAATVHIALDPDKVQLVPATVDAAIVPKTLFGEKFVDLRPRPEAGKVPITDGSVIRQSTTSVEIGELFSRLVPILRTLKPERVSVLLNSMAAALDGRGSSLAGTINRLDRFLGEVDPHVATLTHDLGQLARTADLYADNTPELLRILANSSAVSRDLLVPSEQKFRDLLDSVVTSATTTQKVLSQNAKQIITLTGRARPLLTLLDEYAVTLPCDLRALHVLGNLGNHATGARGGSFALTMDMIVQREPYRYPDDLPSNPRSDANNANLPSAVPDWRPHCPRLPRRVLALNDAAPNSQQPIGQTLTGAGSDDPATGAKLPGYAALLMAPLLADGKVRVR
jgi:phospholipid/cholesterol/gamma-HCH transport system substrate-binding protein